MQQRCMSEVHATPRSNDQQEKAGCGAAVGVMPAHMPVFPVQVCVHTQWSAEYSAIQGFLCLNYLKVGCCLTELASIGTGQQIRGIVSVTRQRSLHLEEAVSMSKETA